MNTTVVETPPYVTSCMLLEGSRRILLSKRALGQVLEWDIQEFFGVLVDVRV